MPTMNASIVVIFFLIVIARVTDVSLDTVRTVAIVQGRRKFAAILGFIQAAIYISAIAKVLQNAGAEPFPAGSAKCPAWT